MKKALIILGVFVLLLGLSGCRKQENFDADFENQSEKISESKKDESDAEAKEIEAEGLIVKDGDEFVLIADGNQIQLAKMGDLEKYLDEKVKVFGKYDEYGLLKIEKIEQWKDGILFYTVGNLYLTQDDGTHLLLQGSVVPELIAKYVGREAKMLGRTVGENNYKFKILEYYIQGVKTEVYQEYENDKFDFTVKYPPGWKVKEELVDVGHTAHNVVFSENNKEVNLILQKEIPRPALTQEDIEKKVLPSGLVVNLYHDEDAMSGDLLDKVIFDLPESGYDFYLSGYGEEFNQIMQSVELLQE